MGKSKEISIKHDFKMIEEFMMFCNKKPKADEVVINKLAHNAKFLPIHIIERKLDEYFSGLWSTENFTFQVVANELVGQIDLKYFHPTAKIWLTRVGVAGRMIQQKKNSNINDITAKIKNTLEKDAPALKAECLKNAAKGIGIQFGRNLNRGVDGGSYNTLSEQTNTLTSMQEDALNKLRDSNFDDLHMTVLERKIRAFSDEAITDNILPAILNNTTL